MKPSIEFIHDEDRIFKLLYTKREDLLKIKEYCEFIGCFSLNTFRGNPSLASKEFLLRGFWYINSEIKEEIKEAIDILWPEN